MILVGYHLTVAYKLYNPTTREVCMSRDVVVDEANLWDWMTQS